MASLILSHYQFPDGRILPDDLVGYILEFLRYSPFQYANKDNDKRKNKTHIDKKTGKKKQNPWCVCPICDAIGPNYYIANLYLYNDYRMTWGEGKIYQYHLSACCSEDCRIVREIQLRDIFINKKYKNLKSNCGALLLKRPENIYPGNGTLQLPDRVDSDKIIWQFSRLGIYIGGLKIHNVSLNWFDNVAIHPNSLRQIAPDEWVIIQDSFTKSYYVSDL